MSDAAVKKTKRPVKPVEHPKYTEMVKAAVGALKERNGSSRQAIEKYIKANYKVGDNCGSHLKLALKRMSEKKELIHTKGVGASGSFKINKAIKEEKPKKPAKKPAAKKPAAKKPAAKKVKKSPKKETKSPKKAKKPATKKASTEKPKKQPTKKPASKPAKKPTAKKPAAAKKAGKKPSVKKTAKSPKKK